METVIFGKLQSTIDVAGQRAEKGTRFTSGSFPLQRGWNLLEVFQIRILRVCATQRHSDLGKKGQEKKTAGCSRRDAKHFCRGQFNRRDSKL